MNSLLRRFAPTAAIAALVLAVGLSAAPPPAQAPARIAAAPAADVVRPALWKVADSDTTIYLFGTVHALPKGIPWYQGGIAQAFEQSHELVTEIVETESAGVQTATLSLAMLPDGQTLRALMTPEERTAYEAALTAQRMPPGAFDRLKPWYAAVLLASMPMLKEGFDPGQGVEKTLDARAKALKRPHSALETVEYQLGLFDSLPQATQLRFLSEVVRTMPEAKNEVAEMVKAWKAGDAETLAQIMNEDEDEPELMDKLLFQRNKAWAEWIKARLDRPGTVFMAVGAGHLAGDGSVQHELAARGIGSTRLQ
jgi:uncharacterized protein